MLYLVDQEVLDRMMEDEPQQYKLCKLKHIFFCSVNLMRHQWVELSRP